MSNLFTERVLNMTAVTPQPEDYMGEDGLLTAASGHTPKEAYFPEKQAALFGRDRHPQNVTARKPSVWSVKPPNSAESTLTPWRT